MKLYFLFRIFMILWFCLMLVGCPAGLEIELLNETKHGLKVLHDKEGKLSTFVEPGTSSVFVQRSNCLKIIYADGKLLEYELYIFSDDYMDGNYVRMKLGDDKVLTLLPKKPEETKETRLKPYCKEL